MKNLLLYWKSYPNCQILTLPLQVLIWTKSAKSSIGQQNLEEDDFDFESAVNSIERPITQRGDLLELGPHRLLCGDSENPKDVERLMDGHKATLLVNGSAYRSGLSKA